MRPQLSFSAACRPSRDRTGSPKPPPQGADRNSLLMLGVGGLAALAAVAAALAFTLGGGGGSSDARAALEAAGCTLSATPALPGDHTVTTPDGDVQASGTPIPPTSGPHYQVPVVYGSYDEPVNEAQLVHNLEHGGDRGAVREGRAGRDRSTAEVVRPGALPRNRARPVSGARRQDRARRLGDRERRRSRQGHGLPREVRGRSTTRRSSAFFDAYQFQGPERFPADTLLPGRS